MKIQTDAYQTTGCYNLLCSGFVQTNNKIAIGAAISPRSSYNGRQFDIGVTVWKVRPNQARKTSGELRTGKSLIRNFYYIINLIPIWN